MRYSSGSLIWIVGLVILGVCVGFGAGLVAGMRAGPTPAGAASPSGASYGYQSSPVEPLASFLGGREPQGLDLFARLAKKLEPTVVSVGASSPQGLVSDEGLPMPLLDEEGPWSTWFEQTERWTALGSGVIMGSSGDVITNYHVVKSIKPDAIVVTLANGRRLPAKLVGADQWTDLALLKAEFKGRLPTVTFGDEESVEVGEWVMSIGNPFGLARSVTVGVLSAKARSLGGPYDRYLQTDAAINPGNSGGPLFDTRGRLIGINTAIAHGEGIGFAIPVSIVREVVQELLLHGEVARGFIGVVPVEITETVAKHRGISRREGVYVQEARPEDPAYKAGVRQGDIIVEFNGHPVRHRQDLFDAVARTPVGQTGDLVVIRGDKRLTFKVKVARRPDVP